MLQKVANMFEAAVNYQGMALRLRELEYYET